MEQIPAREKTTREKLLEGTGILEESLEKTKTLVKEIENRNPTLDEVATAALRRAMDIGPIPIIAGALYMYNFTSGFEGLDFIDSLGALGVSIASATVLATAAHYLQRALEGAAPLPGEVFKK